jgi:hypothetical protein
MSTQSFPLTYCPEGEQVLYRLRQLYRDRQQEIVLAKMNVPGRNLAEFAQTRQAGYCDYPDIQERLEFWDKYTREHMTVYDDSIPSAYLSEMDQGLYGGLFGGDVRFLCDVDKGWISSMTPPILQQWSAFDVLSLNTDNEWYNRYTNQLDKFVRASCGKYGISHFILINGLNFVFELVGATQTYIDLEENPEMIHKAIDLAHETNLLVHKTFFEKVPPLEGGTCSNYAQWVPGEIVSESLDPFHMTAIECFEKWGREPIEKIFAQFDGGVIHIHSNGRHLLESASTLNGLKGIRLFDEGDSPPAFESLSDLKTQVGEVPLICPVEFPAFYQALRDHALLGGVFYDVRNVPDVITANNCMALVRKYCA